MFPTKPKNLVLNRRHPLAKGLQFAFPIARQGTVLRSLVNRNHTLTRTNGTFNDWDLGVYGRSLHLADTQINVYLAGAPSVAWSSTGHAISAFIKMANFESSSPFISTIAGVESGANVALFRFGDATLANNKLQYILNISGSNQKLNGNTGLSTGVWYHVVATFNGTDMKIYINGVQDATATHAGTVGAGSQPFTVGFSLSGRYLRGEVADVRAWTRGLKPQEVAALYADPWALYRPRYLRIGKVPPASPAPPSGSGGLMLLGVG